MGLTRSPHPSEVLPASGHKAGPVAKEVEEDAWRAPVHAITSQRAKRNPLKEKLAHGPLGAKTLRNYARSADVQACAGKPHTAEEGSGHEGKALKRRHTHHSRFGEDQSRVHRGCKLPSDTTTHVCIWNNRQRCLLFVRITFAIMTHFCTQALLSSAAKEKLLNSQVRESYH